MCIISRILWAALLDQQNSHIRFIDEESRDQEACDPPTVTQQLDAEAIQARSRFAPLTALSGELGTPSFHSLLQLGASGSC